MRAFSRYALSAVFAGALGLSALVAPAAARADDDDDDAIAEVLVALSDIYFNGGQPYYRPTREPLYVDYDYGEPRYYRHVPRHRHHSPRYAYTPYPVREMKCDRHGRCKVKYHRDRYRDWDDDDDDRRWRRHRDYDDDDD